MAQQTAIDWLIKQLNHYCINLDEQFIEQAKQMEKEQIINAFYDAELHNCGGLNDAENYYNYIYGTDTNKNTL